MNYFLELLKDNINKNKLHSGLLHLQSPEFHRQSFLKKDAGVCGDFWHPCWEMVGTETRNSTTDYSEISSPGGPLPFCRHAELFDWGWMPKEKTERCTDEPFGYRWRLRLQGKEVIRLRSKNGGKQGDRRLQKKRPLVWNITLKT